MSYILLDNSLDPASQALLFEGAHTVITASQPHELGAALDQLYRAQSAGFHLAGFFSYELGYLLDPKTKHLLPANQTLPLLWFMATQPPTTINTASFLQPAGNGTVRDLQPALTRDAYIPRCMAAKSHIAAGDIYQLNLTFPARFNYTGSTRDLYKTLRPRQPVSYGAIIETDDFSILSFSPELFLEVKDGHILTRPMKGTAPRDTDPAALAADPKCRAENLMIVDLMRNDLARIGKNVAVPKLFSVETYPTLHQLTSDVTATLRPDVTSIDIIRALFPAGSITGAPKLKSMELIRGLEDTPRGIYCGAIGHIEPNGNMRFNVAIRTLTLRDGQGETGIGGAIVADSDPSAEYDEALLKMRYLCN